MAKNSCGRSSIHEESGEWLGCHCSRSRKFVNGMDLGRLELTETVEDSLWAAVLQSLDFRRCCKQQMASDVCHFGQGG